MGGSGNRHLGLTILDPRNPKPGCWSTSYERCWGRICSRALSMAWGWLSSSYDSSHCLLCMISCPNFPVLEGHQPIWLRAHSNDLILTWYVLYISISRWCYIWGVRYFHIWLTGEHNSTHYSYLLICRLSVYCSVFSCYHMENIFEICYWYFIIPTILK